MKGYFNRLGVNTLLLKITSLNAVGVLLQIVGGLITSKLIAIYLGERGMALMGYMRNFLTSVQTTGSLGFGSGVISYVAKHKEEPNALRKIFSTATVFSIAATCLISLVLYIGSNFWNTLIFKEEGDFVFVFKYLAIALPFITANGLLTSYINGLSKYKKVVWINIITNLIGLSLAISLILLSGIKGALTALIVSPAIALLITFVFLWKEERHTLSISTKLIDRSIIKGLGSYTIMAIFSAMVLPVVFIAIRQHIVSQEGIEQAGYWDAMTRISDYYLKFVATLMTLYILPQLAKATSNKEFRKEIFDFYKTILPLFGLGVLLIYFLRIPIIRIIFTEDFVAMEGIFKWQLLGDFFKVASIVVGYQIIAKNMLKLFLITEIISLILIYCTSIYFVKSYGFEGASMGHCLSYFIHLCMLLFIFRRPLFGRLNPTDE